MSSEYFENRQKFLDALILNPNAHHQIFGALKDDENGVCALGMACEALGISADVPDDTNDPGQDPYLKIEQALAVNQETIDLIWESNDLLEESFAEIADDLKTLWGM